MKTATIPIDDPELNVSSLIDMVFLLLVYFMATCSLVKSEGDLGIKLPGMVQQAVAVDMPDEQMIEVRADNRVLLNGAQYGDPNSQELPDLVVLLQRYKLSSQAANNKALITVAAEDKARHQRVIDVLNACADAGIENVTFSGAAPE
jgi:biopolymer transport protein ExbD